MQTQPSLHNRQRGVMLLEALIAILIFSLGILAIVGLQAASLKNAGDAKYRTDASLLANQLIGQMWVADRTPATLQGNFGGASGAGGAAYTAWLPTVAAALPGASATPPSVTFTTNSATATPSSVATIVIFWNAPNEPANAHRYTAMAEIL